MGHAAGRQHLAAGNDQGLQVATLLAAPYSGATLFSFILNGQPEMVCDGEIFSPREGQDCSCGALQLDCQYYTDIASHMQAGEGSRWDEALFRPVPRYFSLGSLDRAAAAFLPWDFPSKLRDFGLTLPPWSGRLSAFLDAHERMVQRSLEVTGTQIYCDGSKIPRRAEIFAASGRFRLAVLHLIRDGRGFCNSYRKNLKVADLTKAARVWLREIHKVDALAARHPELPIHTVRYEDLCKDPMQTLNGIRRFLNLPEIEAAPDIRRQPAHIIGNRMRREFDGSIIEDVSWRQNISPTDQVIVEDVMRTGLVRFGYLE